MKSIPENTQESSTANELESVPSGVPAADGPFIFEAKGLRVRGRPSFEVWQALGPVLARMEGAINWWVGDYLNWGAQAFGEMSSQAVDEQQAAAWTTYAWVARRVEISRRRDVLSFGHHDAVAKLDAEEQDHWLNEAINSRWSAHQLRIALRQARLETADWRGAGGDIWLYLMPALELLEHIPPQSIDLLLTDPPYVTEFRALKKSVFESFVVEWTRAAMRTLKRSSHAFICIGAYWDETYAYQEAIEKYGACGGGCFAAEDIELLIWTYENTIGPKPALHYIRNYQVVIHIWGRDAQPLNCSEIMEQLAVQRINAPDGRLGDRCHTWQKPDELAERFVRHATKPGDVVLDPFAGTGTFLLAAARQGRMAIGTEIDPEMRAIAVERGCPETR